MISSPDILPADLKVFLNHVYEYKKGVRRMVLYTVNRKYEAFATARLKSQHIDFLVQPASDTSINLFFGRPECIRAPFSGRQTAQSAFARRRLHSGSDAGV